MGLLFAGRLVSRANFGASIRQGFRGKAHGEKSGDDLHVGLGVPTNPGGAKGAGSCKGKRDQELVREELAHGACAGKVAPHLIDHGIRDLLGSSSFLAARAEDAGHVLKLRLAGQDKAGAAVW